MWLLLTILCITFSLLSRAQVVRVTVTELPPPGTVTPDTVYYANDRPLQWSDFTGHVRKQSNSAALSFSGFSYDANVSEKPDTIRVRLYLQTYFVRSGSWVRPGEATPYALSHEQIHFNIARLAAVAFRNAVLTDTLTPGYYPVEIKMLFLDYWRKMGEMQKAFDDETGHGTDRQAEALWQQKITKKLLSDSDPG
jgi:hypothetical protein